MGSQSLLVLSAPTTMIPSKIAASSLAPPRPGPLCFPRALTITDSVVFRVKSNSARNKLASSIRCGMCNTPLVLFSVIATILFLLLSKAGFFFLLFCKKIDLVEIAWVSLSYKGDGSLPLFLRATIQAHGPRFNRQSCRAVFG